MIIDLQSMLTSLPFNLPDFMQAVVIQVQALTSSGGAVVELLEGDERWATSCESAPASAWLQSLTATTSPQTI